MLLRVNPLILDAYFLVQSFYVTELGSRLLSQGRGVTAKHLNVGDVKRLEYQFRRLMNSKKSQRF